MRIRAGLHDDYTGRQPCREFQHLMASDTAAHEPVIIHPRMLEGKARH